MSKKTITSSIRAFNPNYYQEPMSQDKITEFTNSVNNFISKVKQAGEQQETEEHIKKYLNDFLAQNFYSSSKYLINSAGKMDSTIKSNGELYVIIEAKRPSNQTEMLEENNINKKALQELFYYYLEETRDTSGKHVERILDSEIRRLIATDGLKWFIFDANDVDRFCDDKLEKYYYKYKNNQLSYKSNTSNFYEYIGSYFKDINITEKLDYCYFDLEKEDPKLVYKVLYPTFLLKEKYTGDSHPRPLNQKFYQELLYIMGLKEETDNGKVLIKIDPTIKNSFADQLFKKFRLVSKQVD